MMRGDGTIIERPSGADVPGELIAILSRAVQESVDEDLDDRLGARANEMKSAFCHFDYRLTVIEDVIKPGYAALTA